MQTAISEGMADVHVALGQLKRTSSRRAFDPSSQRSSGKTGKSLVAALMSINPDRVKRGVPVANS